MLEAGITPSLTLLHVQLPGWLEQVGGWLVRDTAWRFADYAAEMAARFGDRVDRWVTSGDFVASTISEYVRVCVLPAGAWERPAC
jgi:beta-glucosidase